VQDAEDFVEEAKSLVARHTVDRGAIGWLDELQIVGGEVVTDELIDEGKGFADAVLGEKDFKIISGAHPKEKLGRLAARNIIKMLNDSDWINHNYSHNFPVIISEGNSVKKVER